MGGEGAGCVVAAVGVPWDVDLAAFGTADGAFVGFAVVGSRPDAAFFFADAVEVVADLRVAGAADRPFAEEVSEVPVLDAVFPDVPRVGVELLSLGFAFGMRGHELVTLSAPAGKRAAVPERTAYLSASRRSS